MIDKFPTVVPGMPGKRKRNVYVYVPDYATEDMRFPVLYMFDGHNVFFKCAMEVCRIKKQGYFPLQKEICRI